MDSNFSDNQGKYKPLNKVYQEIKRRMSENLENYIELGVPYSISTHQILFDILNDSKIYPNLVSKSVKIAKDVFEKSIPNEAIVMAYIDYYNSEMCFFKYFDAFDCRTTHFVELKSKMILFFEVQKQPT